MAYREVQMWEVLRVLRRIGRGESGAAVARATGHTRRTARRYVVVAQELGWVLGMHEPDEALALQVYCSIRPGSKSEELGSAEKDLAPHRAAISTWLETTTAGSETLRLTKVHRA